MARDTSRHQKAMTPTHRSIVARGRLAAEQGLPHTPPYSIGDGASLHFRDLWRQGYDSMPKDSK